MITLSLADGSPVAHKRDEPVRRRGTSLPCCTEYEARRWVSNTAFFHPYPAPKSIQDSQHRTRPSGSIAKRNAFKRKFTNTHHHKERLPNSGHRNVCSHHGTKNRASRVIILNPDPTQNQPESGNPGLDHRDLHNKIASTPWYTLFVIR